MDTKGFVSRLRTGGRLTPFFFYFREAMAFFGDEAAQRSQLVAVG